MRKNKILVGLLFSIGGITACSSIDNTDNTSDSSETVQITQETSERELPEIKYRKHPVQDFDQLKKLPKSPNKQASTEIEMITFEVSGWTYFGDSREHTQNFAADLKERTMFLYPTNIAEEEPNWKLTKADVKKLQKLTDKYAIQDWKEFYPELQKERSDYVSWSIVLVFKDNTVSKHSGEFSPDQPEDLEAFHTELLQFRDQKREIWYRQNTKK